MKKIIKSAICIVSVFVINICTIIGYYAVNLPDSFYVSKGNNLELSTRFSIEAESDNALASFAGQTYPKSETACLKLFGLLPVKDVEIHTVETPILIPGGDPFGIKLLMEGVMIVGMGEIKTDSGMKCPAEECGLKEGDIIISIDGKKITSNTDIQNIVAKSGGHSLRIIYTHQNEQKTSLLEPALACSDNSYKAGMWVRDSTAGIGTVTFYEPNTNRFGGLGHPVCDSDTGEIIPVSSGDVADVEITKVVKGYSGSPGELHGTFKSDMSSGTIYFNNKYGIFGEMFKPVDSSGGIPMGLKQEIETGPATIYTTIDGNGPQEYDINIEKIDYKNSGTKNMTIKITDKELLEKTGGIVQGMSGSPIIQNGKLIGAVTHVFVSDPTRGYAIFCENMYESGISNY